MRACQVVACQRKVCARASSALPGGGARRVSRAGVCPARSRVTRGVCIISLVYILHMFNGTLKHSTFICVCGSWHAVGTAVEKAPQTTDSDQHITAKLLG